MSQEREDIRLEVSALFDGITELQANLAYPPLELQGQSPVLSLHVGGTAVEQAADFVRYDHLLVATTYVNREAHGASAAEALLDAVYTAVVDLVAANRSGTYYDQLITAGQRSQPGFATIDGKPYRFEEIYLIASEW